MMQWYKRADICFAYLIDVVPDSDRVGIRDSLAHSKWFTRGWTLQELLAPPEVIFLASDWTHIGTRSSFVSTIADVTGIPNDFLLGQDLGQASIAMRMSWAAGRKTTKPEDIAYCLLGIFDIQMPLLYGERETGAFKRLQQQIMNVSDDQSIFAWTDSSEESHTAQYDARSQHTVSLLAHSPEFFKSARNIVEAAAPVIPGYLTGIRTPTIFNNKGLHLSLPIILDEDRRVLAILNCCDRGMQEKERIAIHLQDVSTNGGRYMRVRQQTLMKVSMSHVLASARYASISAIIVEELANKVSDPSSCGENLEYRYYGLKPKYTTRQYGGPESTTTAPTGLAPTLPVQIEEAVIINRSKDGPFRSIRAACRSVVVVGSNTEQYLKSKSIKISVGQSWESNYRGESSFHALYLSDPAKGRSPSKVG